MILVKNYKLIDRGATHGVFDLYLPDYDLMIHQCSHMKSGTNEWINFPSKKYEKEGEVKYFSYIRFGAEMKQSIEKECFRQIKEHSTIPSDSSSTQTSLSSSIGNDKRSDPSSVEEELPF